MRYVSPHVLIATRSGTSRMARTRRTPSTTSSRSGIRRGARGSSPRTSTPTTGAPPRSSIVSSNAVGSSSSMAGRCARSTSDLTPRLTLRQGQHGGQNFRNSGGRMSGTHTRLSRVVRSIRAIARSCPRWRTRRRLAGCRQREDRLGPSQGPRSSRSTASTRRDDHQRLGARTYGGPFWGIVRTIRAGALRTARGRRPRRPHSSSVRRTAGSCLVRSTLAPEPPTPRRAEPTRTILLASSQRFAQVLFARRVGAGRVDRTAARSVAPQLRSSLGENVRGERERGTSAHNSDEVTHRGEAGRFEEGLRSKRRLYDSRSSSNVERTAARSVPPQLPAWVRSTVASEPPRRSEGLPFKASSERFA